MEQTDINQIRMSYCNPAQLNSYNNLLACSFEISECVCIHRAGHAREVSQLRGKVSQLQTEMDVLKRQLTTERFER